MNEEWRVSPDFPHYEISSQGRIKSVVMRKGAKLRVLRGTMRFYTGRPVALMVSLRRDGHTFCVRVHRLVLQAFRGPCPDGMVCCHFDGDPWNNAIENLRWDTPKENQLDSARHGTKHKPPVLWYGMAKRHRDGKRARIRPAETQN